MTDSDGVAFAFLFEFQGKTVESCKNINFFSTLIVIFINKEFLTTLKF